MTYKQKKSVIRAVCFSPERREKFEHYSKSKSPVKVQKFGESNKYGTRSIIIERHTTVETPQCLSFERRDIGNEGITISSLSALSSGQQVTLKCQLLDVFGSKKLVSKTGMCRHSKIYLISNCTWFDTKISDDCANQVIFL